MSRRVRVASRSEVPEGRGLCVEMEGRRIAIFRVADRYYAIDDSCTHMGGPLSEGEIQGEEIECPWHGSRFDLRTGESTGPPAEEPVARYEVRLSGEDVQIEI